MKSLEKYLFDIEKHNQIVPGLDEAIAKLPLDNQTVINLHFIRKIPRKEIAVQLGWSLSKVNGKIIRGITLLKNDLNPSYYNTMNQVLRQPLTAF